MIRLPNRSKSLKILFHKNLQGCETWLPITYRGGVSGFLGLWVRREGYQPWRASLAWCQALCFILEIYFKTKYHMPSKSFPGGRLPTCQCWRCRRQRFDPWVGEISLRRKWQPTPVFLPGELHGQRSLVGYSAWYLRVRHDWTHTHTHRRGNSVIGLNGKTFTCKEATRAQQCHKPAPNVTRDQGLRVTFHFQPLVQWGHGSVIQSYLKGPKEVSAERFPYSL